MLFLHVQLIRAQELHEAQLWKGYQSFHFIFISCYIYSISILPILAYYLIKYLTFPFKSIKMVFTVYWVGHQLILSRVEAIKSGKRHHENCSLLISTLISFHIITVYFINKFSFFLKCPWCWAPSFVTWWHHRLRCSGQTRSCVGWGVGSSGHTPPWQGMLVRVNISIKLLSFADHDYVMKQFDLI